MKYTVHVHVVGVSGCRWVREGYETRNREGVLTLHVEEAEVFDGVDAALRGAKEAANRLGWPIFAEVVECRADLPDRIRDLIGV